MRWDDLFADLEGRLAEAERADEMGTVPDRVRRDLATVGVADRLRCADPAVVVRLTLPAGAVVTGLVDDVGDGWVLLGEDGSLALVVLATARLVEGLPDASGPASVVDGRPLGAALRRLSRDRRPVRVHDVDGAVREGVLLGVGQDHVDLALAPADVPLRRGAPRRRVTLPFSVVAAVRQV